jgi:hypothetical protein
MPQYTLEQDHEILIEELAEEFDATLRSYSGRGMYGKSCLGISIDNDPNEFLMQLAIRLCENDEFEFANTLAHSVCSDQMGLGTILYFPSIQYGSLEEEED